MMNLFENGNDKSSSSSSSMSKILTRRSSVGCSSRISYYRSGEGVPFKWEMQPGIAKESSKEELPPLTPPPAILSLGLGLPKPCILDQHPSTKSRIRYYLKKKVLKRGNYKKQQQGDHCSNIHEDHVVGFDILSRLDCSSDSESTTSPRGSSFSSSTSSLSFINSRPNSLRSTSLENQVTKQVYGRALNLGCFTMHISRVRASIARRD